MPIDLNDAGTQTELYDLEDLRRRLAEHAAVWVPEYYARGKIDNHGKELRLANIRGAPPRHSGSCVITLKGPHAGCWKDFSDDAGGGPMSTLEHASGLTGRALFDLAAEIVGAAKPKPVATDTKPQQQRADEDRAREITFILQHCVSPNATPVESYLQSRGLYLPIDNHPDLRYHQSLTDWADKIGRPAMVAIIRDPATGECTGGVHRTYIADDGLGKANILKPKMMLGPSAGVVMLMPMREDGVLGVGEGIETSLAAAKIFGVPVWAALSAGNMRSMNLPPGLTKLLIFADKGMDGEAAAKQLAQRTAPIPAQVILPRSDDDFAKDLQDGLWTDDLVLIPTTPTTEMPVQEVIPPPKTEAELIEFAKSLSTDSPQLHQVLKACVPLNPLERHRVLDVLRKSTKLGMTRLDQMVKSYQKEFKKEAKVAALAPWMDKMQFNEWGEPKEIMLNVSTALREDEQWRGVIGFDEFSQQMVLLRRPPFEDIPGGDYPEPWTDQHDLLLTEWVQRKGLHVGKNIVKQGIRNVAHENGFHPVRAWLEGLQWDGTQRLDFWLTGYAGVDDSEYARAVGSKFLLSAVARVYRPGCKADCVLIMEGKQGAGKSSALRVMFKPWFTDEIADLGSKDSAMQMCGVWGIELAELDAMDRTEIRRIKAFLTRTNDRYRPPYGEHLVDVPRQCVFCGSINDSDYLRDPSGGRRFWPVRCGDRIDYHGLYEVREQIWAEARERFKARELWHLHEPHLIEMAREQQMERYEGDAWDEKISEYLHQRFPPSQYRSVPDEVRIGEILQFAIGLEPARWDKGDQIRIGKYLKLNEWKRRQIRNRDRSVEYVYLREQAQG